jgi:hypothetical protein
MKTSNLAERLDEFDDIIDSLRLSGEPTIRMVAEGGASADGGELPARPRRAVRVRTIEIRDQGLRSFRVF